MGAEYEGGAFRVGPRSAGADPGPACYGKGGTEATVTDAQVVLGRLDAEQFLGGGVAIDPALSAKAIESNLCGKLDMSIEEAALGIIRARISGGSTASSMRVPAFRIFSCSGECSSSILKMCRMFHAR